MNARRSARYFAEWLIREENRKTNRDVHVLRIVEILDEDARFKRCAFSTLLGAVHSAADSLGFEVTGSGGDEVIVIPRRAEVDD